MPDGCGGGCGGAKLQSLATAMHAAKTAKTAAQRLFVEFFCDM